MARRSDSVGLLQPLCARVAAQDGLPPPPGSGRFAHGEVSRCLLECAGEWETGLAQLRQSSRHSASCFGQAHQNSPLRNGFGVSTSRHETRIAHHDSHFTFYVLRLPPPIIFPARKSCISCTPGRRSTPASGTSSHCLRGSTTLRIPSRPP